jgi:hypothetical protein
VEEQVAWLYNHLHFSSYRQYLACHNHGEFGALLEYAEGLSSSSGREMILEHLLKDLLRGLFEVLALIPDLFSER